MRRAGGSVDHRSFRNDSNALFAFRCPVMQPHFSFDHVHGLVARVDMKLAAVLAPARQKDQGIGMLPKDAHALAGLGELAPLLEQIDNGHGKHGGLLSARLEEWSTEVVEYW